MKKITLYKNCIKKGFALVSAFACIGTFSGCGKDGWQSDDYDKVQNKVSAIKSIKENTIAEIFEKNYTFYEAKEQLMKKGIYLSDSEIEWYLDKYKGANPQNDAEYQKQLALESSILAEQNRINRR